MQNCGGRGKTEKEQNGACILKGLNPGLPRFSPFSALYTDLGLKIFLPVYQIRTRVLGLYSIFIVHLLTDASKNATFQIQTNGGICNDI